MGCGGSRTIEDATKPRVVFVLGGPGSGKGTQSAKLVKDYGFIHLSTGDLLREEAKTNEEVATILKEGKLASSELLVTLIKGAFKKHGMKGKFLLDGFPRSQENADVWNKLMKDEVIVSFLLFFQCSEECMEKRLLKRGETSGRADDNIDSIKERFKTFHSQTAPIVKVYHEQNKVVEINAEGEVEEIYEHVKKVIVEKGLDK